MSEISIIGKGNMGTTIGRNFEEAGNRVNYVTKDNPVDSFGEIVVLAVPYPAVSAIVDTYADKLAGKIIIDITNPVNFETFDGLVVPADSSAAVEISKQLPQSIVVKGFNTNFGATLARHNIADSHQTTVLLASNDQPAKETISQALAGSGLAVLDVGSLKRARELEALGFLQISLASAEKISWSGGFGLFN